MERPRLEVADIFRRYGEAYRAENESALSSQLRRVMQAITACRTATLGGHLEACDHCAHQRIAYNKLPQSSLPEVSIARPCPVDRRPPGRAPGLPLLPRRLHPPRGNRRDRVPKQSGPLQPALLRHRRDVVHDRRRPEAFGRRDRLLRCPAYLGAEPDASSHLHCVVPGGGLSADGERWVPCRPGFFLPVRVLSRLFRRRYLERLEQLFDRDELQFFSTLEELREPEAFRRYLEPLRRKEWVVYAKAPFAGPQQVLDYVGRYTHRVAISNHRLLDIEDEHVTFRWKDYRDGNAQKAMTLAAAEFIRRFLMHVLPPRFHRIRYYGFLAPRHRQAKLERCRQLLEMPPSAPEHTDADAPADYRDRYEALTGLSLRACPLCREGRMLSVEHFPASRAPDSPPVVDTS